MIVYHDDDDASLVVTRDLSLCSIVLKMAVDACCGDSGDSGDRECLVLSDSL